MDSLDKLSTLFERFPGIGPRQARRFVHFLLRSSPALRREIAEEIMELGREVKQCDSCRRFFADKSKSCSLCTSDRRDDALMMLVANDSDLNAIERSHTYDGRYFILGGTLTLSAQEQTLPNERILASKIPAWKNTGLEEIILAFPANPEGDATAEHVRMLLLPLLEDSEIEISTLGRGLSTGSEIEYADPETLKSALEGRS